MQLKSWYDMERFKTICKYKKKWTIYYISTSENVSTPKVRVLNIELNLRSNSGFTDLISYIYIKPNIYSE